MVVVISAFMFFASDREALGLDVIRDRNRLFNETPSGMIENIYTVKVINMDQASHRFEISVSGLDSMTMIGRKTVTANAGEVRSVPFSIQVPPTALAEQRNTIFFKVESLDPNYPVEKITESRFIGPVSK